MNVRKLQIESMLKRAVSEVLTRQISDPRIVGLISVTHVDMSPDLHEAYVYVSVLPQEYQKRSLAGLRHATGYIHQLVKKAVALKTVPRLDFRVDESLKKEAVVLAAIQRAKAKDLQTQAQRPSPAEGRDDEAPADSGSEDLEHVKNETVYLKKVVALLKRVRQEYKVEAPLPRDPVTQMVVAFLEWNATPKAAREAYNRISAVLVDNNDLRVSHPQEVVDLLGAKYARGPERAARLHEALQEIFVREHGMDLEDLGGKPKKQVRTYFDTLPGMTPYVAAQVMLLSFGGHCLPVDDNLADLLRRDGVVEPTAGLEEIASFLEKHVKAGEAVDAHLALQAWTAANSRGHSSSKSSAPAPARPVAKSAPDHKKPVKKSTLKR